MGLFFATGILDENTDWQLGCQVIPNSLIRTSPVQVSEVSHNKVVDFPLEELQVVLRRNTERGREFHSRDVRAVKELREVSVRA